MEDLFALTPKQAVLARRLVSLLRQMAENGIGYSIRDNQDGFCPTLLLYNKNVAGNVSVIYDDSNVGKFIDYAENECEPDMMNDEEITYIPDTDNLFGIALNSDGIIFPGWSLSFNMETTPELKKMMIQVEVNHRTAGLIEEQNGIKKEIERYNNAIVEQEADVADFESKDVNQDLIDDLKSDIEKNKAAIAQLGGKLPQIRKQIAIVKKEVQKKYVL